MLDHHYFRAGDTHHHTKIEAAPPGEAIRFADDIRKELTERAERSLRDRVSFELEAPELGVIKFVAAEQIDYRERGLLVYYKLNGAVHQMRFDPYRFQAKTDMVRELFKEVSEDIARRLLIGFSQTSGDRLFEAMP